jgi:hypothetical protein
MSRGHGKIQKALLAILREHERTAMSLRDLAIGLDTITLASCVYFDNPHCSILLGAKEQVAVRRALAGLVRRGLVIRLGALDGGRCRWRGFLGDVVRPHPLAHRRLTLRPDDIAAV